MRVLTVFGTRPEIIRLSLLIERLDQGAEHVCVYTGQNQDPGLRDVFFDELGVRPPDHDLRIGPLPFAKQVGALFAGLDPIIDTAAPDRIVILGDTNSGLAAVLAARKGIPVYHLEAGNRCGDPASPEEVNRRVIDHVSSVLLPYTRHSRDALIAEGIPARRIHVVGNPISDVLLRFRDQIASRDLAAIAGVEPGRYFLMTLHRAETVDVGARLDAALTSAASVAAEHDVPVLFPVHPRTRDRMASSGMTVRPGIRLLPALGFFDFVALQRSALAVLSDSGTVQEECAILGVPNVVLRDFTERPETVESGASIVAGVEPAGIRQALSTLLSRTSTPDPPPDYRIPDVAGRAATIILDPASHSMT